MKTLNRLFAAVGAAALCAAATSSSQANVISPVPTVSEFAIYRANPANGGTFDPQRDSYLGCVTNYMQYVCAAQGYNYKQYDNPKGYDLSAWPSSGDGGLIHGSDTTWLTPQANPSQVTGTIVVGGRTYSMYSWAPNVLQFYMGWSQLDHNNQNPAYAAAAKGYSLGVIMNQEQRYWDPVSGTVKHVIAGLSSDTSTNYNNVKIDFTVWNSALAPIVVASDDFSTDPNQFPFDPPYSGGQFGSETASAELRQTAANTFSGDWTYKRNSTDGGVIGNLAPDGAHRLVIQIDLIQLGNRDGHDITDIIFYDFTHAPGDYDPLVAASYNQPYVRLDLTALNIGEGDTIYVAAFEDCCTVTPEPMTLALILIGGAGLASGGVLRCWRHRGRCTAGGRTP